MEGLGVWIIIIGVIAWWCYKSGKSTGSRKGYNVGRHQALRRRRRW